MPKNEGLIEPDVTINGQELSFAESMTLRVAVGNMRLSMNDDSAKKALGELAGNYDHHLASIEAKMLSLRKG